MHLFFFAALVFALAAMVFALQNIVPVQVTLMAWTVEGSLALVLFIALIAGAVIGVLASVPSLMKSRRAASGLRKQIAGLESELEAARRKSVPPPAAERPALPRAAGGTAV